MLTHTKVKHQILAFKIIKIILSSVHMCLLSSKIKTALIHMKPSGSSHRRYVQK